MDPHARTEPEDEWDQLYAAGLHSEAPFQYDYEQGQYCMDKVVASNEQQSDGLYATVCSPEKAIRWTDSDFLLRKIINPICHGIAMIILLLVAIVYFVLPTLR